MKLIVSHRTALECIRLARWQRRELKASRITSIDDSVFSLDNIRMLGEPVFSNVNPSSLTTPLEVLVKSGTRIKSSKYHVCRFMKREPVRGMFCKLGENVYTASPEFVFVQMAGRLSLVELVKLGMEFCGTYAFDPDGGDFNSRPALTSKARLVAFCERAKGMRGATTAMRALRWVVDGSNSPAETALVLFLCLPVRLGGYGFELPDMNPRTPLGKRASAMVGQGKMRCDLHWVRAHTVVEYDSDQEHLSSQSASTDARRRNVLGYKDVTVITVRRPMIVAPATFNGVAKQLARALGRRMRKGDFEFTKARSELRIELFPWLVVG